MSRIGPQENWSREFQGQRSPEIPDEKGLSFRLYYPEKKGFGFLRVARFESPKERLLFDLSAMPLVPLHPVYTRRRDGSVDIIESGITIRDIANREIICYKGEKDTRRRVVTDSALSYKCDVTLEDYSANRIVSAYFNSGGVVAVVLNDRLLGEDDRLLGEDDSLHGKTDPDKTDYKQEGLISLFTRAIVKELRERTRMPIEFSDVQEEVRKLGPEFQETFRAILD